jgi:hypothetical protein
VQQQHLLENNVLDWKNPYLGKYKALGSVINRGSVPFTSNSPDLAKRFVLEHLGMNLLDPKLKDIPTLIKKAMAYKMPESPMDKLVEWTKKHASNDADASEAVNLINFVIDQQARQQRAAAGVSLADLASNNLVGGKRGSIAVAGLEGRGKRVRKEGQTDIPNEERFSYAKQKTAGEKLAAEKVLLEKCQAATDKSLNKASCAFMGRL